MRLFSKTSARLRECDRSFRWMTWSNETRQLIREWSHIAHQLPEPHLLRFGKDEYQYSLTVDAVTGLPSSIQRKMDGLAMSFQRLRVPEEITLFNRLIDESIDTCTVRSLFAYIRDRIVSLTGDTCAAIYAPLGAAGGAAQGDFPLHSDLYPPAILFNVFDRVPDDDSGASLFLPVKSLKRMLGKWPAAQRRLAQLLAPEPNEDRYEEFYDFLHGSHPWVGSLGKAMLSEQVVVQLSRGQGYMVNDRLWLHGRLAPTGRVTSARLHRLIFDTLTTRKTRLGQ